MTAISSAFPDLTELNTMFRDIFNEAFSDEGDRRSEFYKMLTSSRVNERFSSVSGMGQLTEFTGLIDYLDVAQGYDVTITPVQFAGGFQVERTLVDDDQHDIIMSKPKALGTAAARTINYHAACPFNNAFSIDNYFQSHSEGVPLCSNSHTTTTGASTASGFDNLSTAALSSVAVSASRVLMQNFRDEQGEIIDNLMADTILVPAQGTMEEVAWEIINSMGKVDEVVNNANFNRDRYKLKVWKYLTDANNWFMYDESMLKQLCLVWIDRVKPEFADTEDFDSLVAKWRVYGRWANGHREWRPIIGHQVG